MHRRSLRLVLAIIFLLAACSPKPVEEVLPSETAIPSATVTNVPASPTSTPVLATESPASQPASAGDWLSDLEVIGAGNWSRLMLLKTYPAEMPLQHSAVAISTDGRTMAVGSNEGAQIFFFDLAGAQELRVINIGIPNVGPYFNVTGIEYLPDGTMLVLSDGPYATYHMDTNGNVLSSWDGIGLALSSDKKMMAYSTNEGINVTDIMNNTPLHILEDRDALDYSFSPDGSKIAAADVGVDYLNTVIWDLENQTALTTVVDTSNPRFSPDGRFLALTSWDSDDPSPLQILSPDGARKITALGVSAPNHLNGAAPLWSVDGSLIAAQVAKGSPTAWETTNWQAIEAPALQGNLYSFSPDGRFLITRMEDGGILLWGVPQVRG